MSENNWLEEIDEEPMNTSRNKRKNRRFQFSWDEGYLRYLPWALVVLILIVLLFSLLGEEQKGPTDKEFQALKKQVLLLEQSVVDIKAQISQMGQLLATLNATSTEQRQNLQKRLERLSADLKTPAPEPKQEQEEKKTASEEDKEAKTHTVQKGDTLYSLAQEYEVSVEQLRSWNQLEKGQAIYPGQELVLQPQ